MPTASPGADASRANRIEPVGGYLAAGLALGYAAGVAEGALVNRAGVAFVAYAALAYAALFAAGFFVLALAARLVRRDLVAFGLGLSAALVFGLEAGFLLRVRANPFEESTPALALNLVVVGVALALGVMVYLVARRRQAWPTAGGAVERAAWRPLGKVVRWLFPATLVGLAAFFLATAHASRPGVNCVLISVDALRADHVGAYGYTRPTTPNLDALAGRSAMWLRVYTQSPGTTGGHAAMLTGLYPLTNGAYLNGYPLEPEVETLAEVFAKNGYATAAFINNWYLSPALGFGQGFDCFVDGGKATILKDAGPTIFLRGLVLYQVIRRALVPPGAPSDADVADAMRWIAREKNHRFFLFLHVMDPHSPYVPPSNLLGRFASGGAVPGPAAIEALHEKSIKAALSPQEEAILRDRYDEEILSADRKIGRVLAELDRLGLTEKTLVVVTADHGEVMDESTAKQFGHGTLDYGCLHVPLVISLPGRIPEGQRYQAVTQTIDITPTIIKLLDLEDTARRQGRPLVGRGVAGSEARAGAGGASGAAVAAFATGDIAARDEYSVVTDQWQYTILGDSVSLRSLSAAGSAQANLAAEHPEVADSLQALLEAWIARSIAEAVVPYSLKGRSVAPGRDALQRLKALGYIQ
jgi:arylsulfatase A-like enzyme